MIIPQPLQPGDLFTCLWNLLVMIVQTCNYRNRYGYAGSRSGGRVITEIIAFRKGLSGAREKKNKKNKSTDRLNCKYRFMFDLAVNHLFSPDVASIMTFFERGDMKSKNSNTDRNMESKNG